MPDRSFEATSSAPGSAASSSSSRRVRWLLSGAVLLLAPCVCPAAPPATAGHVVQLLQLDTGAMLGVKASVREGARQGKVAPAELQCMERLSPGDLTEVLTGIVGAALSPSEIADTDAFYSTPVGRKSIQIGVDQLRQKFGDTTVAPIPPFTAEDEAATRRFSETSAGRKIFVDKVLQAGPAMMVLRGRIVSLMAECKKKAISP